MGPDVLGNGANEDRMIYAEPGAALQAVLTDAGDAVLGVLTVEAYAPATGVAVIGPTVDGITAPRPETFVFAGTAPDVSGDYLIRWDDGQGNVAEEGLRVSPLGDPEAPSAPSPTIATVDDLRDYLHTQGGGASADAPWLATMLAAADRRFRRLCPDRTLTPLPADPTADPVALTFWTRGRVVQVPDLREVASVTVDGADVTDYTLRGRPGEPALWMHLGRARAADLGYDLAYDPFAAPAPERRVTVTGRWGPAVVDDDVRDAVLFWAARAAQKRLARFADTRQDPEGAVTSYFRTIPAEVKTTLDALQVPGV
jgi:hypothetical protein